MNLAAYKISPLALLATITALGVGELLSGTGLAFVAAMMTAMFSIGVTYNALGGVGTLGGILFAGFAVRTIVVSQIAKVLLFERADKNIEAPILTISIYAVFYASAMIGVLLFGKIRLRLPKPAEPNTEARMALLYPICLVLGIVGTILFQLDINPYGDQVYTPERSAGVALAPLLLVALTVAVDRRIRLTNGKHSFGFAALVPAAAVSIFGLIDTVRLAMLMPVIVYLAVCHLRGYRLRVRHYVALTAGLIAFAQVLSPLAIFARTATSQEGLAERAQTVFRVGTSYSPATLAAIVGNRFQSGDPREEYYSRPGTYLLSRLSLIRADSTLIAACSGGYHYGLAQIREVATVSVPSLLDKNKSRAHENNYVAYVAGMAGNMKTQPAFSVISDSFGAFGWPGVVLFGLLGFPAVFVLYDNMFEPGTIWGIVALGVAAPLFWETNVDRFLILLIRNPIYLLSFSYLTYFALSMIPVRGDRRIELSQGGQVRG
jgi:hypothetical protein